MKNNYHQNRCGCAKRLPRMAARLAFLAFGLLLVSNLANAQQEDFEVSGTVIDAFDESPMAGVNVMVRGTQIGTSTDLDGNFTLVAPSSQDTLQFTFIGYAEEVVPIDGQTDLTVELDPQEILGREVVVTGYAAQTRVDLTGSVSMADMDAMDRVAETDVSRQLQGQVSGVTVTQSGQPGDSPQINIRGIGNFGNVDPLFVVDGVPTQNINDLNPRDVESLQVLKDASAASIYGARASNGVILIETKGGTEGLTVEFNSYTGYEDPGHHGNPYNIASPQEHAELVKRVHRHSLTEEEFDEWSHDLYGTPGDWRLPDYIQPAGAMEGEVDPDDYFVNPFYTDPGQRGDFNQIIPANHDGTNWFQEIFEPAATFNNDLAIRGGTADATYAFSLNHQYREGTLRQTHMERYGMRLNTTYDVTDNFRVGQNTSYSIWENPTEGSLDEGTATGMVYRQQPIIPVRDIAGNFGGNTGTPLGNASNPVAMLERQSDNTEENTRLFGNIFAELDFLDNFTFRSNFGGDYSTSTWSWFQFPTYENNEDDVINLYGEGSSEDRSWTWSNTVNYSDVFADVHNLNIVAGVEAQEETGSWRQGQQTDFFSFASDYTSLETGAGDPVTSGTSYEIALLSAFGRFEYNYDERYLISGTLRRDGSSRFQEEQYGTFPAGSIGWRISEEAFMDGVDLFDNLQFRAGYGIMGNQLNVAPENAFTLFGGAEGSTFYPITGGPGITEGFTRTRIGNPGARWEEAHNMNIGFNAIMFGGAFEVDLDYYQNDVRDLLFDPDLPGQVGTATAPDVNVGNVENSGIDATVTGRFVVSENLSFNTRVNITTYNNEIVTIAEGIEHFDGTARRFGAGSPIVRNKVGWPISAFFGYEIEGFWASEQQIEEYNERVEDIDDVDVYQSDAAPGRFRYKDVTGSGYISSDDRTKLGDPHPDFTYGINLEMNYRNFDAGINLYGSQGNDAWNQVKYWTDFYQSFVGAKSKTAVNDAWTEEEHYGVEDPDVTAPVQELTGSTAAEGVPNSYYVEDASYLRLRNLQVGYSFAPAFLERIGVSMMRVYVQGQNLFTITGYSGPDPQIGDTDSANASTASFGVDEGAYPASRQFLFGLNLQI